MTTLLTTPSRGNLAIPTPVTQALHATGNRHHWRHAMKPRFALQDVLFDVDTAAVEAVVSHGVGFPPTRCRVPAKQALVHRPSGRILGIVGTGYRIVTNREALDLAHTVCARAFPGVTAHEWAPTRVIAPQTLSYASIDLHHRAHVLNLSFADRTRDDPYTPFVRVTNSFNGSRALRFDFGFIRSHCTNGCIFERDLASLVVTHARDAIAGLDVKVNAFPLDEKWRQFSAMIHTLKTTPVTPPIAHELIAALLTLAPADHCRTERQRAEHTQVVQEIGRRHASYETELGANAYAVFNTVTDFAARPFESGSFNRAPATLEQRAGTWLRTVTTDLTKASPLDWQVHLTALRRPASLARPLPS